MICGLETPTHVQRSCCHHAYGCCAFTSRARCVRPAGPIYSYFAIFVSVCLSVCHGLGRPGNELMVAVVTYAGVSSQLIFSSPHCKRKRNAASTIDSRGTALITQAQYHESSPRSTRMARNRRLTTNKPRSKIVLVLQYSVS